MKAYRIGAFGALIDEYERAIEALKNGIAALSDDVLVHIVDTETADPDCQSIQTILTHVVRSGFCYAIDIRNHQGEMLTLPERIQLPTAAAYVAALDALIAHNAALYDDYPNMQMEEYADSKKMRRHWGQTYDVEQYLEHAIVHILRHRRQIERFLLCIPI